MGAALPLGIVALAPRDRLIPVIVVASLLLLALLGGMAAKIGGASIVTGTIRVTFWGALAMGATAAAGALFGASQ